ncbi:phospholipase A2 inhibitor gamma subunit B-like [Hemicordylus capensis]|uniref:phospholipase A2 inhibitor gamma subunit B-like n=1 Tax=Hemicordylus capensis TaxID=884348 RepID=UPI002303975D|nr:phospholipase A2 inhibitor gamma subunit B-like [Hemicordylus capensis]
MDVLLGLFLFCVLLNTGAALECEICSAMGSRTCTGRMKTCAAVEETCSNTLIEVSQDEQEFPVIIKGCASFHKLITNQYYFTIGGGKIFRMSGVYCVGEACKSALPELAPIQTKPNGKQCPACHSYTSTCPDEVVQCTGSQHYCFKSVSHSVIGYPDGLDVNILMKGCTTDALCDLLNLGKYLSLPGIGNHMAGECWPAKNTCQ